MTLEWLEFQKQALDQAVIMAVTDRQGTIIEANDKFCQISQYSPSELVGQNHRIINSGYHPPDFFKEMWRTIARGQTWHGEICNRAKDGSLYWVDTTIVPFLDDQGHPIRYLAIRFDITDRIQIENSLRESEQRLQALLDNSTAVIYMKDTQGRYITINHRYEALFHVDRNKIKGKSDHDIFPKEFADAFQANDRAVIAAGVAQESEEVAPLNGELHTYLSIKFPLFDSDRTIYAVCGMSTDISDRKRAEAELQHQKADLLRSNEELQQFAYVASHDLQEPLRMVTSYLDLLERRYKGQLDDRADQFIAYAVDGAKRMQVLIQDLLSYSRVGTRGKPFESVNCEIIVKNAFSNLRVAIAEHQADITSEPLPTVFGDASQLTQVFQNLIGNAIKFHRAETPQIHIRVQRTPQDWVFSVQDNGIGIDLQYRDRIFILFQRLHSRKDYSGTGIGLAMCKKIVERHGGRIWVESHLGEGSTFYFTIPVRTGVSA